MELVECQLLMYMYACVVETLALCILVTAKRGTMAKSEDPD